MIRQTAGMLVLGVVGTAAFGVACLRATGGEEGATESAAIHGTTTVDTNYPAVVALRSKFKYGTANGLNYCTATRVGPYTYLTAAHCVASFAQGCAPPSVIEDFANHTVIRISLSGNVDAPDGANLATNLGIKGVAVHPNTYATNFGLCAGTSNNSCQALNVVPGSDAGRDPTPVGSSAGSDLALLWADYTAETFMQNAPLPLAIVTGFGSPSKPTPYSVHADVGSYVTSATAFEIAGFGANDLPAGSPAPRLAGAMRAEMSGNIAQLTFPSTDSVVDCNNSVTTGLSSPYLRLDRTSASAPIVDHGDSGGPAMLKGGTGVGQIPSLTANVDHVVGVVHGGNGAPGCSAGNSTIDGGLNCKAIYSPTYSAVNGTWLDARLVDFDGDGFKDWEDHCPTVASVDNADSNMDAEYILAVQNNAWPYPDSHTPTLNDWQSNIGYVDSWRRTFKGDACDPDSVTTSTPSYKFSNGESSPCDTLTIYQMGGIRTSVGTSGNNCKRLLNTGMKSAGYIGGPWGVAPSQNGDSQPAYCKCALASPLDCNNTFQQCYEANDATFPYASSPASSKWLKATRRTAGIDAQYSAFTLLHQDPSLVNATLAEFEYLSNAWNFRADIGADASAVFWTHVTSFNGSAYDQSIFFENGALTDRNNHYVRIDAASKNGETTVSVPVGINLFVPIWLQVTRAPSMMVPWMLTSTDASSGQARLALKDADGLDVVHPGQMTSAASIVLAPVANGAIVVPADDVLPGAIPEAGYTALVMSSGTARPTGALKVGAAGIIDGAVPYAAGTATTVLVRSFASRRDSLFSIYQSGGDFYLDTETVSEAFRSGGSVLKSAVKLSGVYGPRAMVWNGGENSLFVLDAAPKGGSDYIVQLLRVSLGGDVQQLWELKADTLPAALFMSAGAGGELVITLGAGTNEEVIVVDGFGKALYSLSNTATSVTGPAVINRAGLSIGSQPRLVGGGLGSFTVDLVRRKDLTSGVCAAKWVSDHIATAAAPLLTKGC